MQELVAIRSALEPRNTLLTLDAMVGQDAVNQAQGFNEALDLTGVVLTKMDGDARGGAALSVRAAVGKPVLYVGVGEKADALEPFFPDRMASRILGMGDVLSLIEKAEQAVDRKNAPKLEQRMRKGEFTLEDFQTQMQAIKKDGLHRQPAGHGARREEAGPAGGHVPRGNGDQAHRGDHQLHDAQGAPEPRCCSTAAGAGASPRGAGPRSPTSTVS